MKRLRSMATQDIGRWILTSEGVVKGHLVVSGDHVVEVSYGTAGRDSTSALVLPGFVNAHTHVADSVAYPAPKGSVEDLVAPPSGYKHRVLRDTSPAKKIKAMRSAVSTMFETGTTAFADFREEGLEGVQLLARSMPSPAPRAIVLGRPSSANPDEHALELLLDGCDGLGMSSISDWPVDLLVRLSRQARARKKFFAIHASETVREDIDVILGLEPHFVVHMTNADEGDIAACAEHRVPIVVCPRANAFYGLTPNIPLMISLGATVALGTDNGMISKPDMIEELKAAFRIGSAKGEMSAEEAVKLATFNPRKVLNQSGKILTKASSEDDLVVINVKGEQPLTELVTTATSRDVVAVVQGGTVWRTEAWTR